MTLSIKIKGRNAGVLDKFVGHENNTKIVNGQQISLGNGEHQKYTITSANSTLEAQGTLVRPNNQVSLNDQAIAILSTLNCTIEGETKEFSIIATQTDTEVIENPNILNATQYAILQNKTIDATYSFPNPNDPFFELDAGLPHQVQAQRDTIKAKAPDRDVKLITADLINWNVGSKKTSTLPQFKKGGK